MHLRCGVGGVITGGNIKWNGVIGGTTFGTGVGGGVGFTCGGFITGAVVREREKCAMLSTTSKCQMSYVSMLKSYVAEEPN